MDCKPTLIPNQLFDPAAKLAETGVHCGLPSWADVNHSTRFASRVGSNRCRFQGSLNRTRAIVSLDQRVGDTGDVVVTGEVIERDELCTSTTPHSGSGFRWRGWR